VTTLEYPDALAAIEDYFERGWTDGLPIVPPTEDRVEAFLAQTSRDPDEVLARMPPIRRSCTVRQAAINAVMAGCRPEYFPVIVAALDAAADPGWVHPYWYILNASTSGQAPLYVINGPVRNDLGINSGVNVFGPGWRANMTIGRAIRLILLNVFDLRPGILDMSTQGQPGKLALCIGENEEESPWGPFHVDRGFKAEDSTLTYMSARGTHPVENRASQEPDKILQPFVDLMTSLALVSTPTSMRRKMLVIGPEHAHLIATAGWSKAEVKQFVYERARRPRSEYEAVTRAGSASKRRNPEWDRLAPIPERMVRSVNGVEYIYEHESPEDVLLVVAGAPNGGTSALVPLGVSRYMAGGAPIPCAGVVTRRIERPAKAVTIGQGVDEAGLVKALQPISSALEADGYFLNAAVAGPGLKIEIVAGPEACEDCLVPKDMMARMITSVLSEAGVGTPSLEVTYPNEH
jgi:hypothetical protein